jgi:hypothetical protein
MAHKLLQELMDEDPERISGWVTDSESESDEDLDEEIYDNQVDSHRPPRARSPVVNFYRTYLNRIAADKRTAYAAAQKAAEEFHRLQGQKDCSLETLGESLRAAELAVTAGLLKRDVLAEAVKDFFVRTKQDCQRPWAQLKGSQGAVSDAGKAPAETEPNDNARIQGQHNLLMMKKLRHAQEERAETMENLRSHTLKVKADLAKVNTLQSALLQQCMTGRRSAVRPCLAPGPICVLRHHF